MALIFVFIQTDVPMRIPLILLCCLCWQLQPNAQTAVERPILLIFSGSDWCLPCIQLEKTILSDTVFLNYAEPRLEFLRADFPQREKQNAAIIRQNETLAERYNPEGAFPKVLLLHPDRSVWAQLHWKDQTPQSFTQLLDQYLNPK